MTRSRVRRVQRQSEQANAAALGLGPDNRRPDHLPRSKHAQRRVVNRDAHAISGKIRPHRADLDERTAF